MLNTSRRFRFTSATDLPDNPIHCSFAPHMTWTSSPVEDIGVGPPAAQEIFAQSALGLESGSVPRDNSNQSQLGDLGASAAILPGALLGSGMGQVFEFERI